MKPQSGAGLGSWFKRQPDCTSVDQYLRHDRSKWVINLHIVDKIVLI